MLKNKELQQILLKTGYVDADQIAKVAKRVDREGTLQEILLKEGFITKDILGQALSEHFKVSYSDLNTNQPTKEQVNKIPEAQARKWRIVLFSYDKKNVVITTDDPKRAGLSVALKTLFSKHKVKITYSLSEDIDEAFLHYRKELATRFSKIIKRKGRVAPEILDEIFMDAALFNASDIHFEPRNENIVVRFRVDGVLQDAGNIPREYYENIINRIKVESTLRIDEHFAAQDGSMRFENGETAFDLRTSIVPTVQGEKIVLRVLASYVKNFQLGDLGLSNEHEAVLKRVSSKPFGMILTTGPTGSGKTTSLYALLKIVNTPDNNVTTIEDPVEYRVVGINQIQVNRQTDLTFAKGLRSIVRQDPDVILVGEIRDVETAEIAVNAALTGHLLFSTFHANDAATAIPRLLDMGIEPFLLSSTLEVVSAQRLVRKICEKCRYSESYTKAQLDKLFPGSSKYFGSKNVNLYKGKGCVSCGNTGFKGRTGVFEFIEMTPDMRNLILENPSTQQIWELAKKQGATSMFDDGVDKVKAGITTIEELLRVAAPPYAKRKTSKK